MMTAKCLTLLSACTMSMVGVLLTAAPLRAQLAQPAGVQQRAMLTGITATSDEAAVPRGSARRVLLVAGGTVLGAAIGGGAGYAIAAVRCGRRDGCAPAAAYPYPRFGVIAGAVIGGGIAYGSSGPASLRHQAAASTAGILLANAGSWLAGRDGTRTAGIGAHFRIP